MFTKTMYYTSAAVAAVCAAMTVHDFWVLSTPSLRFSMATGTLCTAVALGLVRAWKSADAWRQAEDRAMADLAE